MSGGWTLAAPHDEPTRPGSGSISDTSARRAAGVHRVVGGTRRDVRATPPRPAGCTGGALAPRLDHGAPPVNWCTLYPALCERYSVIAIDHRGRPAEASGGGSSSPSRTSQWHRGHGAVEVLEPGRRVDVRPSAPRWVGRSRCRPWRRHPDVVAGVGGAAAMEMHKSARRPLPLAPAHVPRGVFRSPAGCAALAHTLLA